MNHPNTDKFSFYKDMMMVFVLSLFPLLSLINHGFAVPLVYFFSFLYFFLAFCFCVCGVKRRVYICICRAPHPISPPPHTHTTSVSFCIFFGTEQEALYLCSI